MIAPLLVALALPRQAVVIATPRGQTSIPVTTERGQWAVAASRLAPPLELTGALDGARATAGLGGGGVVVQVGGPFVRGGRGVYAVGGGPDHAAGSRFL